MQPSPAPQRPSTLTRPPTLPRPPTQDVVPTDDSPLALLQAQLLRAEAALEREREARARLTESMASQEIAARIARSESRARTAEEALSRAVGALEAERKLVAELEADMARLLRELGNARRELDGLTGQRRTDAAPVERKRSVRPRDA